MVRWKINFIIFIIVSGIIIAYPFSTIRYFESVTAMKMYYHNFMLPVGAVSLVLIPPFYFKKVKALDTLIRTKTKQIITDVISCIYMVIIGNLIFFGMVFSAIITSNAYLGTPKTIMVKQTVENYTYSRTRYSKNERHIEFKNPETNKSISLQVYREYKPGELFIKKMNVGYWGILYSID